MTPHKKPECCEKCGRTSTVVSLNESCPFCSPTPMTKTNETGWEEEFDAEFKRDDDPSSIFPSRLSDVKAFIEREIAAAREQAIKEAIAAIPEARSHMDDKNYPHDDCMHCTVWNECRESMFANLAALAQENKSN